MTPDESNASLEEPTQPDVDGLCPQHFPSPVPFLEKQKDVLLSSIILSTHYPGTDRAQSSGQSPHMTNQRYVTGGTGRFASSGVYDG
jgi:hypothetical protein